MPRRASRTTGLWLSLGLLSATFACTSGLQPTLPDPNADVGLGDIALLVWTTRSPNGLLGHVYDQDSGKVDAHRRVVEGTPRLTPTDQHLVVVSAQSVQVDAEAGTVGISVSAKVDRATHVAYDVRITGYLELFPEESKYLPGCGCCQGGGVSEYCGEHYVTRLIRGSGKVQHLQKLEVAAGIEASELVRARGGTTYRRLNETEFTDAFFAYQLEPLETLCSHLAPEEELETLAVKAPNNCWVQAHLEDGNRESRAWHVPNAALCRKLAEHHCKKQEHMAACTASFGGGGQAEPIALFDEPVPPTTTTTAATGTIAGPAAAGAPAGAGAGAPAAAVAPSAAPPAPPPKPTPPR